MKMFIVGAILLLPFVSGKPSGSSEEEKYGYSGNFFGFGGNLGGSVGGSIGSNFGIGFNQKRGEKGNEFGVNLHHQNMASGNANGNFNLGFSRQGYFLPPPSQGGFGGAPGFGFGNPQPGGPGFGNPPPRNQPGFGNPPPRNQPGFGNPPQTPPVNNGNTPPRQPQPPRRNPPRGREPLDSNESREFGAPEVDTDDLGPDSTEQDAMIYGAGVLEPRFREEKNDREPRKRKWYQKIKDFFGRR